jgi:hypothetical protein
VTRGDAKALPHQEAGLESWDTWQHWSPPLLGGGPDAMRHATIPEPSRTRRQVRNRGTRGDTGACPHREAGPMSQDTWGRWSPPVLGAGSGTMGLDLGLVPRVPGL